MAAKTVTFANTIINTYIGATATPFVGLFLAGDIEVSGVNYVRTAVTFSAAVTGATSNSAPVSFAAAGAGGWGTIHAIKIFDALAGTALYEGTLLADKAVDEGDTVSFAALALQVTES